MADTAAQTDEQDFSIPGQDDDTGDFAALGKGATSSTPQASPTATPSASAAPSMPQVDTSEKIHPHVAILAGLVNKILGGIQNAPGNPNNALDRGFMNASPQNQQMQQAQVSKAMSEADQAKMQTSITGMKALQYKYLLKRLPQEDQAKHLQSISDFKQNLIKEGANVEAEGDDEKASDAQATQLNGSDPRSLNHTGKFYSLPTMDKDGKPKFDVVFVPSKDTLQNDYKWTDPEGNEQTIPAGTPISAAMGKFVENQQKGAQSQTKELHKQLGDALKPNVPDSEIPQTIAWLQSQAKQNTPLYQQNKNSIDAQISTLEAAHKQAQDDKIKQAKAMATQVTIPTAEAKQDIKHEWDNVYARDEDGDLVATNRKTATAKGLTDIDDTVTKADIAADRKNAPLIKDIRDKISDYQNDIQKNGDLSAMEATEVRGIMAMTDSDFEAKLEPFGIGVGIKPSVKQMQEMFRGYDINNLSDKAQTRLATYIAARSSALELQKAQTQTARASKEGLTLDLAQLPNPGIDGRMANKQLDLLMKSIDRISSSNPFVNDTKTKKLVKSLAGPKSED